MIHEFIQTCTGNKGLDISNRIQQIILPAGIQLRQDIIQHQYRPVSCQLSDDLYFRKLQRQGAGPLLSLGTELTQIYIRVEKRKIISVGTCRGLFQIAVPVSGIPQPVGK